MIKIRKGQAPGQLQRVVFHERFMQLYQDPAFAAEADSIARLEQIAWDAYKGSRKSPVTRKAGRGFADPSYDLSVDWIAARDAVKAAQKRHDDKAGPSRFLIL